MRRLPKSKRNRIVNSLFSGKTYRDISDAKNVSIGKISDIYKEFVGTAEEYSIREASEEYSVEEKIDHLLELAKEKRELKVPLSGLLAAARLTRMMRARGLEASQLEDYMKMCDKHRLDFPNFASKATELFRMEERTAKSYEKIVEEYPALVKKNTELQRKVKVVRAERREEVKKLKKETRQAKEDLEHELASNNLVREEIPFASALKKSLGRCGYTIRDTSAIPKFLREIEVCGADVEVFIERAEEAKDLKWEILDLKDEKKRLEPVVETIKKDGLEHQKRRDELQGKVKDLEIKREELEGEIKGLDTRATERSHNLRLTACLTSILRSRPADVDILYMYASRLREIAHGERTDLVQRRPYYEEEVKRLMADTLSEYLKDELATRQEVTVLQEKLKETETQNSGLSDRTEKLVDENTTLRTEKTRLTIKVERLEKELQECSDRLLRDPLFKPKDTILPF